MRGTITYCALASERGLLAVTWADALTFLQGQLTCDMRELSAERSLLGAFCSPKGRVIATCRIFQNQDELYLALTPALLETVRGRLSKYVLRAKVTWRDTSHDVLGIGMAGDAAATLLAEILGTALPAAPDAVIQSATALTVLRVAGAVPRFEVYGNAAALQTLQEALAKYAQAAPAARWRWLDILAGLPSIYPATLEAFVPQMLNLDALGAISWQKGCYTGQEIVARTQYLGALKRRMYLARVASADAPPAGAALYAELDAAKQEVGRVVSAAAYPDGGYALLAVLRIEYAGSALYLSEDAALELLPLPYVLPAANAV